MSFPTEAPVAMHSLDRHGRIIDVTNDWLRLLGYDRAEIIGRPLTDIATSETARIFREQNWPAFLASGEVRNVHFPLVAKKGEVIDSLISARAEYDAQGQYRRSFGVVTDLRERLDLERKVVTLEKDRRQLEQEATLAIEAADLGVWQRDLRTDEVLWSPRCRALFGVPPDMDITMDRFLAMLHPEDRGRVAAAHAHSVSSHADYDVEYRLIRPDRSEGWFNSKARPFADAAGRPERMIGVIVDITARKRAEAALRKMAATLEHRVAERTRQLSESEARYRATADAVPSLLFSARPDGFVDYHSKSLLDYTGLAEEDLRGHGWISTVHPDDAAGVLASWQEATRRGQSWETMNRIRRHDQTYRWFVVRAVPQRDADGRVMRWFGACTDVDDMKRAEAAQHAAEQDLRRLADTLEERVRERTRSLAAEMKQRQEAEAALHQTQKMETIGQLTGGVAHDFNNVLTVIIGDLELLAGRLPDDPRLQRLASNAMAAACRAERLTHHLLAFSRKQQLDIHSMDVAAAVRNTVTLLRRTLGERIEIAVELADGLWPASTDSNQFEIAVLNLALNARDAMPQGGRIAIRAANAAFNDGRPAVRCDLAPGDYVEITLSDTGAGMSPEMLARIFEPFFTTKPRGEGTGLGLAQVYGFAKQSGGGISVESREGTGSTFHLFLPRALAPASPGQVPARREGGGTRSATVLVVEDDAAVRNFTAETLRELGYVVLEAGNGDEAVTMIEDRGDIDLVFSDIVMPGALNGIQLARVLRERWPDLPVLLTSGYSDEPDALHPIRPAPVLNKPFRPSGLAAAIEDALARATRSPGRRSHRREPKQELPP